MNKWYESKPEDPIVIASRVQLRRNVENFHFVGKMGEREYEALALRARALSAGLEEREQMKYYSCSTGKLSPLERKALEEAGIISNLLTKRRHETALILSEDEGVSIMVNEEDHLCIQANAGGANLNGAYLRAVSVDDCFEELGYAYDERYGYLTASPQNVGTGLLAEYLVFLPAITMVGKLAKLAEEIGKYGIIIRGVLGEGTKTEAFLYRIINQKTLGGKEEEIIGNIEQVLKKIVEQELRYRKFLCEGEGGEEEIADKVYRSYGILRYAKKLASSDALMLFSQLKFGRDLGMISFEQELSLYEQFVRVRPANLQKLCGKNMNETQRELYRAEYFNRLMNAVGLKD